MTPAALADELEQLHTTWIDCDMTTEDFNIRLANMVPRIIAALRSADALAVPREPTEAMKCAGHLGATNMQVWTNMWDAWHAAQGTRSKP